ncbi:hypothetical protein FEM48_Zijuj04G0093400 [Ziziphus jujuba var. spinosa]|uniref:Uncharacterized protein n=1 Tax=Ziziphus jujuba var. spinosa TaxID=714518 RepID=A0A978VJ21_ZIZJJ|nr:hypothetical protein FEM48_Zijuj04G0093400 [Ziziphus jujuba var. spinosa]
MAISNSISSRSGEETPLLLDYTVEGVADYKGLPVLRSKSGGWRSAGFIIGVEITERFAYYGISSNLINFLTGPLGQSTATAAENVNAWSGTSLLLPLLGAFVADSFWGDTAPLWLLQSSTFWFLSFHFPLIIACKL